jgi:predicted nucleotidyltransferase component of viral defense system
LEEIVAEKLRAILQHAQMLRQRGWSRSRARDYYDLWRILSIYRDSMDLSDFNDFLHEKCAVRSVDFTDAEAFFEELTLGHVEKTWDQWLGTLVPGLPSFAQVIGELRPMVVALIQPGL